MSAICSILNTLPLTCSVKVFALALVTINLARVAYCSVWSDS